MIDKTKNFLGKKISFNGKQYSSLKKLCKNYDVKYSTFWFRFSQGKTIEESLNFKDFKGKQKLIKINLNYKNHKFETLKSACKFLNLSYYKVHRRINGYGWTLKQALELEKRPGFEKGVAGLIYMVTNISNKKKYIGITMTNISKRWSQHVENSFTKPELNSFGLHHAIRKYGPANFKIERIDKAKNIGELSTKESKWIKHFKTLKPSGYNLNAGGTGLPLTGKKIIINEKPFESISEACRYYGLNESERRTATRYINEGWSIEEALGLKKKTGYKYRSFMKINIEGTKFSNLAEACKFFNLNTRTVWGRISRGWSIKEALELEKRNNFSNFIKINFRGKTYQSQNQLCKSFNVNPSTFRNRKRKGKSIKECLGIF